MANVPYTPYSTVDASGGGGTSSSARATSNDFGAQVSSAAIKAGDTAFELAQKQQGMINETLYTNSETEYRKDLGTLTGEYRSLSGLEAVAARPKYVQDVTALRQKYRSSLPAGAQHSFDMLALRYEGNAISDANLYAATQIKRADYDSSALGIATSVTQAGYIPVAEDDHRFGETIGDIRFHIGRQFAGHPGIEQDEETGTAKFADTPEGEIAKADFNQRLQEATGMAWQNRFQALAEQNVLEAREKYLQNKDKIPTQNQVALDAFFYPRVRNETAKQVVGGTLSSANQGYSIAYAESGSSVGSSANNLGNVKTPDGSRAGTADFVHPATPLDGTILAANTLRRGYQGMTLAQIGVKWTGEPKDKSDAWVSNASKASGIDPNVALDLNDPAVLTNVLKGIATAEKSPSDRARFTDQVIAEGVQASIGGQKAKTAPSQPGSVPPPSRADYYRANYTSILEDARIEAEKRHPGDTQFAETVRIKTEQHLNDVIRQQELAYKAEGNRLYQASTGALTNGKKPTSMDEIAAISPEMKSIVGSVMVNQPQVYNAIESHLLTANSRGADKDSREYGSGFYNLFKAVHAAPGDPNRITDQTQLYSHIGPDGDLTVAGLDKLTKELSGKGTPDGESEAKMREQSFKSIKRMLSGEDDMLKIRDPKGELIYAHALPMLYKAIDDGKAKGVPAGELYDPQSKNWIGNSVVSLKRSLNQMTADMLQGDLVGESVDASGLQGTRTLEAIIKDVKGGKIDAESGKAEAIKLGFIRAEPEVQIPKPE